MSSISELRTKHLKTAINAEQSKDAGLALTLILLLIGYLSGQSIFYILGILSLILVMSIPGLFKPFGIFWYTFTSLSGSIVSAIILTIIFYAIVYPVAVIRRANRIDNLKLKEFKKSHQGIMHIRDHTYTATDIEKPY